MDLSDHPDLPELPENPPRLDHQDKPGAWGQLDLPGVWVSRDHLEPLDYPAR